MDLESTSALTVSTASVEASVSSGNLMAPPLTATKKKRNLLECQVILKDKQRQL